MITITYGTAYSTLTSNSISEERLVRQAVDNAWAIRVPGYFFTPAYKKGFWDGFEHFFSAKTGRFPTGLLARVLKTVKEMDPDGLEVVGFPESWPGWETVPPIVIGDFVYRDYQMRTIRQILRYHRGIVKVATNGGKTDIWSGLLKVLGSPPSIFYVPRKEIFGQTVLRFEERLGHSVGRVGDGTWAPNVNGVTVAMYHTVHKRLKSKLHVKEVKKWLNPIVAVGADECHMLSAEGYRGCFDATGGDFRVGMSGTPFNKDKEVQRARLIGATGAVLSDVTNEELIERGISEVPHILFVTPRVDPKELSALKNADYMSAVHYNTVRNRVIATFARAFVRAGMQTMIFVSRTKHGLEIKDWLPEGMLVTSETGNRKEARKMLEDGVVFPCICTAVFDTGLSVDHIQGMINAAEGQSDQIVLQRVGRTLRKKYDKNLWIVDFWDNYNKFTKKHSRARFETYESQKGFIMEANWRDAPLNDQEKYELIGLLSN
jgi:superfamily II DNA or RNA helicase